MQKYEQPIQRAAESLYGDERLRSNLTDSEAKIVLNWAASWVAGQVSAARDEPGAKQIAQNELARVRQIVGALNALAAKNATPRLEDAIAAINTGTPTSAPLTREQVLSLATLFATAMWKIRSRT
jgi:hypothetical protein